MTALLMFSGIAALLVWLAGRKDDALDPRLTTLVLGLLAVFPLLWIALPKFAWLPAPAVGSERSGFPWPLMVGTVWVAGFLISLIRLIVAACGIGRWRRRSRRVEQIGRVEVRLLEGLRGPVAAGVFRKVVFVPADWETWAEERRRMVLDHELMHLRRQDPLRRWISEIALAIHWFNPLVHWIAARLKLQCEYACDAAVLRTGVSPREYAGLLCELAETSAGRSPVLAMAERSGMEARVRRMLAHPSSPNRALMIGWIVLAGLSAVILASGGSEESAPYSREEVELRWTAEPFPGG